MITGTSSSALVVGAHSELGSAAAAIVEAPGVQVDYEANGAAALVKLGAARYKLVISEWSMEPVSGVQLLKFLRAEPHLEFIPFIMLTRHSDPKTRLLAFNAGVNSCLDEEAPLFELERVILALL